MTFQRSLVASFFFLVTFTFTFCAAAVTPLSIRNITTPTTVDLYVLYYSSFDDDEFDFDPLTLFHWDIFNGDKPLSRDSTAVNTTIEIMTGPPDASESHVVDIAATNAEGDVFYSLPASLPLGLYHARINATVKTLMKSGNFSTKLASALGPTINVTAGFTIGCGVKTPAPYSNITSPSSPEFTSLYIYEPSPGEPVVRQPDSRTNDRDEMYIGWDFRDQRNLEGVGIFNISIQILDSATSSPVGPVQIPIKPYEHFVKYSEVPMEIGKSYKVQLKYRNDVRDGVVPQHGMHTVTTPEFIIVNPDDYDTKCIEPPLPSNSSNSNNNPNKPNSATGDWAHLRSHSPFLWCLLVAASIFF